MSEVRQRELAQSDGARRRCGMTLAELLVTITILGAMSTLIIPHVTSRSAAASQTITIAALNDLRGAIRRYYADMFETLPFPQDASRAAHPQLAYLFVNPATFGVSSTSYVGLPTWSHDPTTARGWSGPYLTTGGRYTLNVDSGFGTLYGLSGDPAPVDAWGNPIVLQQPFMVSGGFSPTDRSYARLVSAGPNGIVETLEADAVPAPGTYGDDLFLALGELYPGSGVGL